MNGSVGCLTQNGLSPHCLSFDELNTTSLSPCVLVGSVGINVPCSKKK